MKRIHWAGRTSDAGGAAKGLRAMETYIKQKIVTNHACFCSSAMLTTRMVTNRNYTL